MGTAPIVVRAEGPLMVVTYYGGATDEEYIAYLAEMTRLLDVNRGKYTNIVVINDATRWIRSSAKQRALQAEWISKRAEDMKTCTAGIAFVLESALVRGGLTAVLWLTSMPCPYKVVSSLPEAFVWARQLQGRQFPEPLARTMLRELANERSKVG